MSQCFAKWIPEAGYWKVSDTGGDGYTEGPGGIIGEVAKLLLAQHADVRLGLTEQFGRRRQVGAFDEAGRPRVVVTVEKSIGN